jgi:hypothetical protein
LENEFQLEEPLHFFRSVTFPPSSSHKPSFPNIHF